MVLLIKYQTLPSLILHDVAHDGVLSTFSKRSTPDRGKWCGPSGQAAWSVHHVQNLTLLGHSPPTGQAGRRVGPALYSLAFGLIVREAELQHVVLPLWTISVSDPDPHCCGSPGSESGTDSSEIDKIG
jgi:hypothetical protein